MLTSYLSKWGSRSIRPTNPSPRPGRFWSIRRQKCSLSSRRQVGMLSRDENQPTVDDELARPERMIRGSGDLLRPQNASLSQIAGKSASLPAACRSCWFQSFTKLPLILLLLPGKRDKGNRPTVLIIPSHRYWSSSVRIDSLYSGTAGFSMSESLKVFEFFGGGINGQRFGIVGLSEGQPHDALSFRVACNNIRYVSVITILIFRL